MSAAAAYELRTGRWELVASASTARISVGNFARRVVTGDVPIRSASVELGADGVPGQVEAVLDLAALDTGNSRRDADLRKPKLLDTARHPDLTFTGTPARIGDDWQVRGRACAREHEVAVTLSASLATAADGVSVTADTDLEVRAFGVRAPRLLIGRTVHVHIEARFIPAA
ncbi:MAG TPA: YceI family protein [Jatrophihabitans sp.]|nr:YceI family protein [Jatrophihabitans sp.]